MSEQFPSLNLRLMGVGVGAVFRQHTEGSALLVPGAAALAGAGDEWDSEMLPLYTCLAMSSPAPEGSGLEPLGAPTTPLFLDPQDAQASLDAALEAVKARGASPAQLEQMQLVCTSMPSAVDIVLGGKESDLCGDRFQFVAPRASLVYLRDLQQQLRTTGEKTRQAAGVGRGPPSSGRKLSERMNGRGGAGGLFPS